MEPLRGERIPEAETPTYELKAFSSNCPPRTSRPYDFRNRDVRRRWLWKIRNLSSNLWLWELSACALSLVLVALIIYQLKKIDNKETYYWTWPWEPTAVLAFSVTIMKAAIMVPVASSIGQLKWHWYRNTRKLEGMEHFDEASRGVLGSLTLLLRLKFWRLASVGAIITISSLAVDTLAQNAVKIHHVPYMAYDSAAYVYATNVYNFTTFYKRRQRQLPSRFVLSNVNFALTTWGNLTSFNENLYYCSKLADYCDFPAYQSLAVDAQCINLEAESNGSVMRHPSSDAAGLQLDLREGLINATTSLDYPTSSGFTDLGPLIFRWFVLVNGNTEMPVPVAMECAFYWVVQSYEGRVTNYTSSSENTSLRTLSENVTLTRTNTTDRETTRHDIIIKTPPPCRHENSTIKSDPCYNYVTADNHAALQSFFTDDRDSMTGYASNDTQPGDADSFFNSSNLIMNTLLGYLSLGIKQIGYSDDVTAPDITGNVTDYAHRLAYTLTYTVRTLPWSENYTHYYYAKTWGNTKYHPDIYYQIWWRYLILPIGFVIAGSLFFVATVVLTWRDTKWKSSMLAVLFHGLSPADLNTVGDVDGYADMREVGRDMQARLAPTDLGKKLMSRDAILDLD